MPPKKATGAVAAPPKEVPEIVRPPLEAVAVPEGIAALEEPVADPVCLDFIFPEWSDELLETFEWGEEGVVYEEVLPKLPANLACTISTWQRPIDYIRQPLPPEPVEGEEDGTPQPPEPVTMAGPGNWNEIEKDGEGRQLPKIVIPPVKVANDTQADAPTMESKNGGATPSQPDEKENFASDGIFKLPREIHCEFQRSYSVEQAKDLENEAAALAESASKEAEDTSEDVEVPPKDKVIPAGDETDTVCVSAIKSVAALVGSLGESTSFLWENIYPQADGRPSYNPAGKYLIKLFIAGKWRAITIDDRIPVGTNGNPVIAASANSRELWPTLLAKAVYKVYSNSFYSTTHIDLLRSKMGKTGKGPNSIGLATFVSSVVQMFSGWMPQLLPKDWDTEGLMNTLSAAQTPKHAVTEFNVDFEYQKLFRAMKMAAKKRKKKTKKKEVTQEDVDVAFEKRQEATQQLKAEIGAARDRVYMVCFATELRKLPKREVKVTKVLPTEELQAEAPPTDTAVAEPTDEVASNQSPAAASASLIPNANMEIYPVLGIIDLDSESKILVKWSPKDMPPDPMVDDGLSFKFLSLTDLKKAGGIFLEMHTLATSKNIQTMRYHWALPAPEEGQETPVFDPEKSLVYPGPVPTMLAHIAPSENVTTLTTHLYGDPDKLSGLKSQSIIWLQPMPLPIKSIPQNTEEKGDEKAETVPSPPVESDATTEVEAKACEAETTRAEDKTLPDEVDISNEGEPEIDRGEKKEVDEEKQAEDMKVEEGGEKLEKPLDDAKVELAPPVDLPLVKHIRMRLTQSATTPFATSTTKLPATSSGLLYKLNLDAPAGAYVTIATSDGTVEAITEANTNSIDEEIASASGEEKAPTNDAATESKATSGVNINLGPIESVWPAVGGAYEVRKGEYEAIPSSLWKVLFRRIIMLPDQGCTVRLMATIRDIGSEPFTTLIVINNDTHEQVVHPLLTTAYESWVSAAKGYTVMLVAYSAKQPLPGSSWSLSVLSSAPVVEIKDVACSIVTRFGASYLPNKYNRLFRDVLKTEDLSNLSLRLELPDPKMWLLFRVLDAQDPEKVLHEIKARKVVHLFQLKPADGESLPESIILDALLDQTSMIIPKNCISRRPYYYSNESALSSSVESEKLPVEESPVEDTSATNAETPQAKDAETKEEAAVETKESSVSEKEAALPSWLLTIVSGQEVILSHDLAKEKAEAAIIDGWEAAEPGRQERARSIHALYLASQGAKVQTEGNESVEDDVPLEEKRCNALALEDEEDREKEKVRIQRRLKLPEVKERLIGNPADQVGDQSDEHAHLRHIELPIEASEVTILTQEDIDADLAARAKRVEESTARIEAEDNERAKYLEDMLNFGKEQKATILKLREQYLAGVTETFQRRETYRLGQIARRDAFAKLKEQGDAAIQKLIDEEEAAAAEASGDPKAAAGKKKGKK